jgi:predicted  nucleic acid-binding Zn-ribbon protein
MNPFEMVVAIVVVVTIGGVLRARYGVGRDKHGNDYNLRNDRTAEDNQRLRGEIGNLKERIAVLERVITDNNGSSSTLDREIEKLRDRDG